MITPTTFLEVVNIVLSNSQLTPVESLSSGDIDAEAAEGLITETLKEVQARGWSWNTEVMKILPDTNGNMNLPTNTIEADPVDRYRNTVQRGSRLYDLDNNTYAFSEGFDVILVLALDLEELPETVRRYVALKASRVFQQRGLGDVTLNEYITYEERIAWAELMKADVRSKDGNHILGGPTSGKMKSRIIPRVRRYGRF